MMVEKVFLVCIEGKRTRRTIWIQPHAPKRDDIGDRSNHDFAVILEADETTIEEVIRRGG